MEEEYFTLEVGRINDHIKDCIKQRRITFELIKDYLKEEDFFLLGTLCELFSYNTKIKSELEFLLENMPINEKINSSGVKFTKELELHCKGRRVYIVDDIVDTGKTMMEILLRVNDMMPAEVKIVTLLKRKEDSPPVDHFCFEIDKEWVIGYGLDDNGLRRNYRNIYKIN